MEPRVSAFYHILVLLSYLEKFNRVGFRNWAWAEFAALAPVAA
jgi:hypothetical protein